MRPSSSSTSSASAAMPARPRSGFATPTAAGARSSPARPTACSWTATSSPTSSTIGGRRAWSSSATRRSASPSRPAAGPLAVALEHPSDDIDPGAIRLIDPELATNLRPNEELPDFTAMVRYDGDWGHVQLSGLARKIGFDTLGTRRQRAERKRVRLGPQPRRRLQMVAWPRSAWASSMARASPAT